MSSTDIKSLLKTVFGSTAPSQRSVSTVTIPEDTCQAELDAQFKLICKQLSSTTQDQAQTIAALDYLIYTPLCDHHRFLPYLKCYCSDLLVGCTIQLNYFIEVEYPKLLADAERGDQNNEIFTTSQRLLQSLAIVVMNLIFSTDFSSNITVAAFTSLYTSLLPYYIESENPRSPKWSHGVLYLIAKDSSLWIDKGIIRKLAPNQLEAIFETIHKLIKETQGQNQLTDLQWSKARILFRDVEWQCDRILEAVDVNGFLKQANSILNEFPASAFPTMHNYRPLEFLSDCIIWLANKKGPDVFHLDHFKPDEPIVAFTTKLIANSKVIHQEYLKTIKQAKVQIICQDEIDLGDLFDPDKTSPPSVKPVEHSETPKTNELTCMEENPKNAKPMQTEIPKPAISKVAISNPIESFHEQIANLSTSSNIYQSQAILAYLNRNLDDFIAQYPGALEPKLNTLVHAIALQFRTIHLLNLFQEQAYFYETTALLKRIFKYSHLLKILDFEQTYPELLLSVSSLNHFYDCDYGYHAIKDLLFLQLNQIHLSARLLFCLRMLIFTELTETYNRDIPFHTVEFFNRGLRRLITGVGSNLDNIDQLLTVINAFTEYYHESYWTFKDACDMERQLGFSVCRTYGYSGDTVFLTRKLLFEIVKSQGESIWIDYQQSDIKDPERKLLIARFIRLALATNFKAQLRCTRKDKLRDLNDWPVQNSNIANISNLDELQESWNFSLKSYPDNSQKITELTEEILPKLNSSYKEDYKWTAATLKNLQSHLKTYAKNPKHFGGSVITGTFELSLKLLDHYIKIWPQNETIPEIKDAIESALGLLEALLNIEVNETNNSVNPYPKFGLNLSLDQYADLLEMILSTQFYFGITNLMKLNWLLQYKPNSVNILTASIRVFIRAAQRRESKAAVVEDQKMVMFKCVLLAKFLGDYKEKKHQQILREERMQVLVKRFRTTESVKLVLQEAGQFMELFKGSFLEREYIYSTWQVIQELLNALVSEKLEDIRAIIITEETNKAKLSRSLVHFLEQSLKRLDDGKNLNFP